MDFILIWPVWSRFMMMWFAKGAVFFFPLSATQEFMQCYHKHCLGLFSSPLSHWSNKTTVSAVGLRWMKQFCLYSVEFLFASLSSVCVGFFFTDYKTSCQMFHFSSRLKVNVDVYATLFWIVSSLGHFYRYQRPPQRSHVITVSFKFGNNFYFTQGQKQLSRRSATHHQHIHCEI